MLTITTDTNSIKAERNGSTLFVAAKNTVSYKYDSARVLLYPPDTVCISEAFSKGVTMNGTPITADNIEAEFADLFELQGGGGAGTVTDGTLSGTGAAGDPLKIKDFDPAKVYYVNGSIADETGATGSQLRPYKLFATLLADHGTETGVVVYLKNCDSQDIILDNKTQWTVAGQLATKDAARSNVKSVSISGTSTSCYIIGLVINTTLSVSGAAQNNYVRYCTVKGATTISNNGYLCIELSSLEGNTTVNGAAAVLDLLNSQMEDNAVLNVVTGNVVITSGRNVSVNQSGGMVQVLGSTNLSPAAGGTYSIISTAGTIVIGDAISVKADGTPAPVSITGAYNLGKMLFDNDNSSLSGVELDAVLSAQQIKDTQTFDYITPVNARQEAINKAVDDALMLLKSILDTATRFRGFISDTEPDVGLKNGYLWYNSASENTSFPWAVKTYTTAGGWSASTTNYTPSQLDLWSRLSDDTGLYWFGNVWNINDLETDGQTLDVNTSGKALVKDQTLTITENTDKFANNTPEGFLTFWQNVKNKINGIISSVTTLQGYFTSGKANNAVQADKLATARTISMTGDVSGSASFDGSANVSIPVSVLKPVGAGYIPLVKPAKIETDYVRAYLSSDRQALILDESPTIQISAVNRPVANGANSWINFNGSGYAIPVGGNYITKTTDGISWTPDGIAPGTGNNAWAFENGTSVLVISSAAGDLPYTSPDMINWTAQPNIGNTTALTAVIKTASGRIITSNADGSEVFRTDDFGATWVPGTSLPVVTTNGGGSYSFAALLANLASAPNRVVFINLKSNSTGSGTGNCIAAYSDDNGASWTLGPNASTSFKTGTCMHAIRCGRLICGTYGNGGVLVSDNGGQTWFTIGGSGGSNVGSTMAWVDDGSTYGILFWKWNTTGTRKYVQGQGWTTGPDTPSSTGFQSARQDTSNLYINGLTVKFMSNALTWVFSTEKVVPLDQHELPPIGNIGDMLVVGNNGLEYNAVPPYMDDTYSTGEINTGNTWINGKSVYKKVISVTNSAAFTEAYKTVCGAPSGATKIIRGEYIGNDGYLLTGSWRINGSNVQFYCRTYLSQTPSTSDYVALYYLK